MVDYISADQFEKQTEFTNFPDKYKKYRDGQDIPVHTNLLTNSINELETAYWERTAQKGAIVNQFGADGINDILIHDIEPEGEIDVQKHLFDISVFVSRGVGSTKLNSNGDTIEFDWKEGSLFYIPPNTPYQFCSNSNETTSRLIVQTPLPQLFNLFKEENLFYNCEYEFESSIEGKYSQEGQYSDYQGDDYHYSSFPNIWDTYYVYDLLGIKEHDEWPERGPGKAVVFPFPESGLSAHRAAFPSGTYKKAHRHAGGYHIIILSGEGYSLMWREGWNEKVQLKWQKGSMFTPPSYWYHSHFNTGDTPVVYMALHPPKLGTLHQENVFDSRIQENIIEYDEEDISIREHFEKVLSRKGVESNMERYY